MMSLLSLMTSIPLMLRLFLISVLCSIVLFVLGLLAFFNRKIIFNYIHKFYTKVFMKMNKSHIDRLERYLKAGKYQKVLDEISKLTSSDNKLSEEEKFSISVIRDKAVMGKLKNDIESSLKKVNIKINSEKIDDADNELDSAKRLLEAYQGKDKSFFENHIKEQEVKIIKLRFNNEDSLIKSLIEKGEWEQALSKFDDLKGKYNEELLNNLFNYCKELISKKARELFALSDLNNYLRFISTISKEVSFTSFVEEIKNEGVCTLVSEVERFINDKDYDKARSFLGGKGTILDDTKKKDLQNIIKQREEESLKQDFLDLVKKIDGALAQYDFKKASELKIEASNNPFADETTLNSLSEKIQQTKKKIEEERKYEITSPLFEVGSFNKPKENTEGEDAEPYTFVDSNRNWGVIGVFDGMGGAGARKYTHEEKQEVHTSAYWGSLFVRQAVEEVVNQRIKCHKGENPIDYIESHLYQTIKEKLDEEIENFPEAKIKSPTKMVRKLPTTMALCTYFIKEGTVTINCYWAGDSRVYLLNGNKMFFLTHDDANAPDNDPFSPANMDLAMNNAICQDQPFKINKYSREFDISEPFAIMAATDGCFGYFKNPIKFEFKIRNALAGANSWDAWKRGIYDAIYKNGQQDDYSMALVVIGSEEKDFNTFQGTITSVLRKNIFSEYQTWENDGEKARKDLDDEIAALVCKTEESEENKKSFIRKQEKLKKLLGDINQDADLNSDLSQFIENLSAKIREYKSSEEGEEGKLKKIYTEISTKKAKLEELLLEMERNNNLWYQTYKDECVEIVDSNQISHLN